MDHNHTVLASTTPTGKASAWHIITTQAIGLPLTFGSPSRSVRRKVLNHKPALVGKEKDVALACPPNHMHVNIVLIMIAVFMATIVSDTKLTL